MNPTFEQERIEKLARLILSFTFPENEIETIMYPPALSSTPVALRPGIEDLHNRRRKALAEAHRIIDELFPESDKRIQTDYKKLFKAAAEARDAAGFIGTVPACIESLSAELYNQRRLIDIFRDFVNRNAITWLAGASHQHPIWKMLANVVQPGELNVIVNEFIQPLNRETLEQIERKHRIKNLHLGYDDEIPF